MFTFAGTGLTIASVAKLGGASVSADPRNADFGKIKFGNTRYDPWGGFQQYIRLAAQLATGEIVSSTTGKKMTLGEGYKPMTRLDVAARFFEYKEAPVMSFVTSLLKGQTSIGEPFNVKKELVNRVMPMMVQDLQDLFREYGPEGLLRGVPGVFGIGSQTYSETSSLLEKESLTPNDITKAKKMAASLYLRGQKQEAVKLVQKFDFKLTPKDITDAQKAVKRDIINLYLDENKEDAVKTAKEFNITLTREEVAKAAKKKAISLYRNGDREGALKLKQKYGFILTPQDVD